MISKCHSDCKTCSKKFTESSSNCDTCVNVHYYLQEGNCVPNCSIGYYLEGHECKKCHNNCLTCYSSPYFINGILMDMKCIRCKKEPNQYFDLEESMIQIENNCYPIIEYSKEKIIFNISELSIGKIYGSCLDFNLSIRYQNYQCLPKPVHTFYVLNDINNTGIIKDCDLACNTCFDEGNINNTNCISCNFGYFKTEDSDSNCILKNLIPINYYKNQTNNIYYKCHENCYNCTNGYISDNMNCITCKHNYYFIFGDNKSNCYDKTLINNGYYFKDNLFYLCDNNCLTCSEGKNESSNNCLTCDNENNLYMLEDLNNCEFSNYTGYYLDNNTFILKRCYTTCKTCNGPYENNTLLNFENHNCILCAENYYKLSNGSFPNNCYDKVIIDLWSKEFFTTNEIVKIITTDMLKEGTTYKIIEEGIINIEKEETNKTLDDIITNITDIMKDKELGVNYEIKGDNFTIVIKPTNSPPLPNTTHVDFDDCEKILRKEYNISNIPHMMNNYKN